MSKKPTDEQIEIAASFLAADVGCSDDEEKAANEAVAAWLFEQLRKRKRGK